MLMGSPKPTVALAIVLAAATSRQVLTGDDTEDLLGLIKFSFCPKSRRLFPQTFLFNGRAAREETGPISL